MTITEALLRVGDELKTTMIQKLKDNGSYDTGALGNSITYDVRTEQFSYQLVRTMLTYGNYVDQGIGRGKGKQPPVQAIMDWLTRKAIPIPTGMKQETFAFLIARKIGERGTDPKPRPFIAPSIQRVLETTGKELLTKAGVDTVVANINGALQDVDLKA